MRQNRAFKDAINATMLSIKMPLNTRIYKGQNTAFKHALNAHILGI